MGYFFKGFFATGAPDQMGELLAKALERWPFCTGQRITTPFQGIGVRCPDPEHETTGDSEEAYWELKEKIYELEDALPAFSAEFPGVAFVFIFVDCTGGTCAYSGFVARGGQVERRLDTTFSRRDLKTLLEPLGVKSRSGYFQPFVRGYWKSPTGLQP